MWQPVWFAAQGVVLAQAQAPSPGLSSMLFPLVLMFAVMYFLLILPNQRRERQRRELLDSLSKGDRVVTHGGIKGKIVGLTEKSVVLQVSENPNVKLEFVRQAVHQIEADKDAKD